MQSGPSDAWLSEPARLCCRASPRTRKAASLTSLAPLRSPRGRVAVPALLVLASLAALLTLGACRGSSEARLEEVRVFQDAGLYAETVEPLRELVAENP